MYPQRSVLTCGLATALEPPNFNHALVRGAIGAIQYVAGISLRRYWQQFARVLAAERQKQGGRNPAFFYYSDCRLGYGRIGIRRRLIQSVFKKRT